MANSDIPGTGATDPDEDDEDRRAAVSKDPMDPASMASLKHWGDPLKTQETGQMQAEVAVDCGWGRLIFGQTFDDPERLSKTIQREKEGRRDIALYVRDPHVVISCAPQDIFIDPSHTYRLDLHTFSSPDTPPEGIRIRPFDQSDDPASINRLYLTRHMVPPYDGFYDKLGADDGDAAAVELLVAEDVLSHAIVGVVTGVDHTAAFNDPDNGCSLWSLAVDPQAQVPAIGEWLSRMLAARMQARGRRFMDLSVIHNNRQAIRLYQKMGFNQVPVYCLKNRNVINERLFVGPEPEAKLNIYAQIITNEARRRGISVEVLDADGGFFRLSLGGRSIVCRESLSELTSAIAMSRCDDKSVTRRILLKEGLRVPDQQVVGQGDDVEEFLRRHESVVVKPARGEQGRGITVGLTSPEEVSAAIEVAANYSEKVIIEEYVQGEDLRIIVIDYRMVAAAVRRPPEVIGNGNFSIEELITKLSRRREAATGGESTIPLDAETARCVAQAGHAMSDILPEGESVRVRKTANLHTGGTIHDVTGRIHPVLERAACRAAGALEIPVVGLDLMVPDLAAPDYVLIEANERPGLANHEPQPTAECFIDLLFPNTRTPHREARL